MLNFKKEITQSSLSFTPWRSILLHDELVTNITATQTSLSVSRKSKILLFIHVLLQKVNIRRYAFKSPLTSNHQIHWDDT